MQALDGSNEMFMMLAQAYIVWQLAAQLHMFLLRLSKLSFPDFAVRSSSQNIAYVSSTDDVRCRVCTFVLVPSAIRTLVASFCLALACLHRHTDNS